MSAKAFVDLWLAIRPIRRIRQWRKKRAMRSWIEEHGQPDEILEDFNQPREVSMSNGFATQLVLAVLRHAMTAAAPAGVVVSDDWLVQTAAILVGVAGLAWSGVRKWKRAE